MPDRVHYGKWRILTRSQLKHLAAAGLISSSVWLAAPLPGFFLNLLASEDAIPVMPEWLNFVWIVNSILLTVTIFVVMNSRRGPVGRAEFTLITFCLATFPVVIFKAVYVAVSAGPIEALNAVSAHLLLQIIFGVSPMILMTIFATSFAITRLKLVRLKPTFGS
jgi:hypothetical protein